MPVSKLSKYRLSKALRGWLPKPLRTIALAGLFLAYVAYREGHIDPADARLWFTQLAAKTAERPSERLL